MVWHPLPPHVRESMGLEPVPKRWRPSAIQVGSFAFSAFFTVYAIAGYKYEQWLICLIAVSLITHDVLEIVLDHARHMRTTIEKETNALKQVNAFQLGVKLGEEHGPKVMIKEKSDARPN